jgi:hypothetical protein
MLGGGWCRVVCDRKCGGSAGQEWNCRVNEMTYVNNIPDTVVSPKCRKRVAFVHDLLRMLKEPGLYLEYGFSDIDRKHSEELREKTKIAWISRKD